MLRFLSLKEHRRRPDDRRLSATSGLESNTRSLFRAQWLMVLSVSTVLSFGCSKEKLSEALEEAKSKTKSLTEATSHAMEERLPSKGSLALQTSPTTAPVGRLNLELISVGDGRPSVIQITTYDAGRVMRSYPAVMLHGTTDATTTASLVGSTIDCDVYFQSSEDKPIAITKPGETVSVTFDSLNEEDETISATLGTVTLLASDDSTISIEGGQAVAVIKPSQ